MTYLQSWLDWAGKTIRTERTNEFIAERQQTVRICMTTNTHWSWTGSYDVNLLAVTVPSRRGRLLEVIGRAASSFLKSLNQTLHTSRSLIKTRFSLPQKCDSYFPLQAGKLPPPPFLPLVCFHRLTPLSLAECEFAFEFSVFCSEFIFSKTSRSTTAWIDGTKPLAALKHFTSQLSNDELILVLCWSNYTGINKVMRGNNRDVGHPFNWTIMVKRVKQMKDVKCQ